MSPYRRLLTGIGLIVAFLLAAANTVWAAGNHRTETGAAPFGWVTVESCTSVTGTISYQPGLTGTLTNQTVRLSATLSGCSSAFTGAQPGTGTLTATLSGAASTTSVVGLNGTFVLNWPTSSGLNPSSGSFGFAGPSGGNYATGGTVSSGAFLTSPVRVTIVPVTSSTSGGAVTGQTFTNSTSLTVQRNNG
jgi:hypothetical protein